MKERTAAAHDKLAVAGIYHRAGSAPIGIKLQRVFANVEEPRLRIVAGRSQQGVFQKELPLVRCCAIGREVVGRYAPRISGYRFHRLSFDGNVA